MGWINPMILIISWTTLLIFFYDITVTSYAQIYQKCIDLGDNGVLSIDKKMRNTPKHFAWFYDYIFDFYSYDTICISNIILCCCFQSHNMFLVFPWNCLLLIS